MLGSRGRAGRGVLGQWQFGAARLYVPGAKGPVRGPVGYGAVTPKVKKPAVKRMLSKR